VVLQESVPMSHPEDDSVEKLEEKIHKVEHVLIVQGTLKAIEELKS
jgi:folate-dependent phosphoribosylglycinamide formyltransferase PurN